ncbi:MAG: flagellar hook assembly protein FlgD [Hydrocarboniphaga sp.]|uniref:flagellar hook assembly protein FlgD n=1 Tax=Hydrocarboniphaga sp. TaxID=2033016 RepID=UPI002632FC38|nr:flagellar hook assembly protein FlgD [Hydrocarboniphaga sp.]MDB5967595.1 flagellar hook assembly protein FlgD [Hydrocarboniphaga sp.]
MTTPVSSNDSIYSALGLGSSTTSTKQSLGQDDFLKLMTVQIQNQDPMKPMENTEFFSQIAQFSTVSGIDKLQGSFSDLATQLSSSQSLQAAALIGHDVLVPSSVGVLYDTGMGGAVDVPSSGDVRLEVRDGSGVLVRTLDLGTQPAGQVAFRWDGTDSDGDALSQGLYKISATVQSGSASTAATTYALDQVGSVSIGSSGGLNIEMVNLGEVAFSDVTRIQ